MCRVCAIGTGIAFGLYRPNLKFSRNQRFHMPTNLAFIHGNSPRVFQTGDLQINLAQFEVRLGRERVGLTQTELRLLFVLVRNAGKAVTQRQLLNEVWGPDSTPESLSLRDYMGQLRRKLERDPNRPQYLKTESDIGYRLVAEKEI